MSQAYTSRRAWLARCLPLLCSLGLKPAAANSPPHKIIVGFPPGGGADQVVRLLSEPMRSRLGAPVIIDNRPGAGGVIAIRTMLQGPVDSRTLIVLSDHQLSVAPLTIEKPGYHPIRDFEPVATVALGELALAVYPGLGVDGLPAFARWLARNPARDVVGIPAPASPPEFLADALARKMGISWRTVPYRGGAAMIQDLMGGQIPAGIATVGEFLPFQQAGQVRILAVSGAGRMKTLLPDTPTFGEIGIRGFDMGTFLGAFARAGIAPAALEQFNRAIAHAMQTREVQEGLSSVGMVPHYEPPAGLAARRDRSIEMWGEMIRSAASK